jgi:predicted methyltransferase
MRERLDRVHVKLSTRDEPFTLSWDSREQLLDQARGRDELRGVLTAFEGAGASRPITLKPDDEARLLKLLEAWAKRIGISELPAGIWDLRCALADDLHDAAEHEQ